MQALEHLTLTTGHTRKSPRHEVSDDVIMRLQHIVDDESGRIPELGLFADIIRPMESGRPKDGAAAWTLLNGDYASGDAVCMGVVCWRSAASDDAWRLATEMQSGSQTEMSKRAQQPRNVPWLAVILFPQLAILPPDVVQAIGDMERCLAWTIIETPGTIYLT